MITLAKLREVYDELESTGTITREQAVHINKLTEGGVSQIAHPNSFTEAPSTDNVENVLGMLSDRMRVFDIKIDAIEAKNLLRSLIRRKSALGDIYKTRISVNTMMRILSSDIKIGEEPINGMSPERVVELEDEFNDLFGKAFSISKLRQSVEDFGYSSTDVVGSIVSRQALNTAIKCLGDSIDEIERKMATDVEFTIPNRSKLFRNIKKYNNDLCYNFAEFILSLIEDQSYMDG